MIEPISDPSHRQVAAFLRIRWGGLLLLATVGLISALVGRATVAGLVLPLILLAVSIGYGLLVKWGTRRWTTPPPWFLPTVRWLTPAMDLLLLAILCHHTGGVISIYALTPLLYIVSLAPMLGVEVAYLGATWATILYAGLGILELEEILPLGQPFGPARTPWMIFYADRQLIVGLLISIAGLFYVGAYMGSRIARSMARQQEKVARLYQTAQAEASKLRLINELSRALSAILDWPTLLDRVWKELDTVIAFDYAVLYLYDEPTGQFRLVSTRGLSPQEAQASLDTAMARHPGWVLRHRRSLVVPDTAADPRVRYLKDRRSASIVMVPLLYQDCALGVLGLGSRQTDAFSTAEQELLEGVAGQMAIAVANAQLYEESRRTLRELRQTQEQLVRSGRLAAVGELIAGLAHELNNPLSIILGNVQLLLQTPGMDIDTRSSLERTEQACQRIARMVRVLGELELLRDERFAAVDLADLLEEALDMVYPQLERQDVVVEQQIERPLRRVWGSRARLLQVIYNLLLNALEAMRGQERPKRLAVAASSNRGWTKVSLRDTGRGIPAEQLSRVLEPGFTTKVEEGRSRALGLGLFVAYYTVRAHGGDLEIASQLEQGTEVIIQLPTIEGGP